MKRKLALLLAGSMVLSTVSTSTIFAAASASVLETLTVNPDKNEDVYKTVTIDAGEGKVIPMNSIFNVTLENAVWDTDGTVNNATQTAAEAMIAGGDIENVYSLAGNTAKVQTSSTAVRTATFGVPFSVTDASKPVYVTIQSNEVAAFEAGVKVKLTNVVSESNGITITSVEATQVSPYNTDKDATIVLMGNAKGDIKAGQKYTFKLPAGYEFNGAPVAKFPNSNISGTVAAVGSDMRTFTVTVPAEYVLNTNAPSGSIELSGFGVINNSGTYDKDVNVTVSGAASGRVKVAEFATYTLKAELAESNKKAPVIEAGDGSKKVLTYENTYKGTTDVTDYLKGGNTESENLTAKIKISENLPNSYRGGDFKVTLPEGVVITGINVTNEENTREGLVNGSLTSESYVKAEGVAPTPSDYLVKGTFVSGETKEYRNITIKDNVVVFENVYSYDSSKTFEFEFELEIQTKPNWSGDVTATLAPMDNVFGKFETQEIGVIAKVEASADFATKVTEVPIGFTNYATSDIVITELGKNEFEDGEILAVSLVSPDGLETSSYGFSDADVSATGDAKVEVKVKNNVLYVTVVEADPDEATVITLSGVEVYSDQTTPRTVKDPVGVKIKTNDNDRGNTMQVSLTYDYAHFVEELTSGAEQYYNKDVVMSLNSETATLADGTTVDLYGAAYISADNNYMVPVKGMGFALGLDPEDIVFDNVDKIATFFLPNGDVAQIQVNNAYAIVNGTKLPLIDGNGNLVTPVIKEGRFYLPLRACANRVFNVEVDYNDADKTVVVNPTVK